MNYSKIMLAFILITLFLLINCAPKEAPSPVPEAPPSAKEEHKIIVKEGWEKRWEEVLQAARKEGKVVVYGGSTAAALKLHATKLFKEKFGLDLEVLTGRGGELPAKIMSERRSGLFIPDVYASGLTHILDLFKPMGFIDYVEPALILPEVIEPNVWFGGKFPWTDEDHKVLNWAAYPNLQLAINTSLVQPAEIKSYQDLLDPRWKGKIVMNDPTVAGTAQNGFIALLYNNIVDLNFFRHLAKQQDVIVLRDQHLQIGWLARGKFLIALFPSTGRMEEYLQAGAPIALHITKEGIILGGGGSWLTLMNRAPHPNAAAIFINWFLSREGQKIIQTSTGKQSMRIDIPIEGLLEIRQPGIKYLPDPTENEKFILQEKDKYVSLAEEIFGPLLR